MSFLDFDTHFSAKKIYIFNLGLSWMISSGS